MNKFKFYRTWIITGLALVIGAVAIRYLLIPIFWSSGGPEAPERFDEVVETKAFVDVTRAAGFTHI
ncbi:MAG: hypothetical protein GY722_19080, partial [bacterium]|nr:hypothetical protein [bacterium]